MLKRNQKHRVFFAVMETQHTDCYKRAMTYSSTEGLYISEEMAYRTAVFNTVEFELDSEGCHERVLNFLQDAAELKTWLEVYTLCPMYALFGEPTFTLRPSGTWFTVEKMETSQEEPFPPIQDVEYHNLVEADKERREYE
jgi:hypothetical protein